MKIAVIGTGIAGLGVAYLLHQAHDLTVYEANSYIGGHSRTIDIDDAGRKVPVDTGFIVFNELNYPHLTGLFGYLGVETIPSDMSFGASIARGGQDGWLEYGSKGMFAQRANLIRPKFWGMLRDILRFNRTALAYLKGRDDDPTLRAVLDGMNMGDWFRRYYLLAMGAAIWSCPADAMLDFPARTFLNFFDNHGLLTVNSQPQWHTVKGGSRAYVSKLAAPFRNRIRLDCGVAKVERVGGQVVVTDSQGGRDTFDHVVFACHADQALAMLDDPSATERSILGAFRYQSNKIVVHSDTRFMPRHKGCWSSWVYLADGPDGRDISLSYWMNALQSLQTARPVIITLNPAKPPLAETVQDEHAFDHPVFDLEAIRAQGRLGEIQGAGNVWHCGAYQRYGFHEDGLLSAVNVAAQFGIAPPWS